MYIVLGVWKGGDMERKINHNLIVYSRKHYNIYKCNDGSYVVHNTKKSFDTGHTHIGDLDMAKVVVDVAVKKKIPHKFSRYLLISLLRISDNYRLSNQCINRLRG